MTANFSSEPSSKPTPESASATTWTNNDSSLADPVASPDAHRERFKKFVLSGEEDDLTALEHGVERDTVGSDGMTETQRENVKEERRHEEILQEVAPGHRPVPEKFLSRSPFGFDSDLAASETDDEKQEPDTSTPPTSADEPEPDDTANPEPRENPETDDEKQEPDTSTPPTSADEPEPDDTANPEPRENPETDVEPLWRSVQDVVEETYDPGPLILDPAPVKPQPGRLSRWFTAQRRRLWQPLELWQKLLTAAVVASLCAWGLYLISKTSHARPKAPLAAPVVDAPERPTSTTGPLPPARVEAPGCPARSSPAANAFGADRSKAWVCVRLYGIDLNSVNLTYDKPVVVTSICVVPGFDFVDSNGRDFWNEHRVVTKILWRIGGQQFLQDIDPAARTGSCVQIPNVAASSIKGTVMKSAKPPSSDSEYGPGEADVDATFAVSKITVNGRPAGGTN